MIRSTGHRVAGIRAGVTAATLIWAVLLVGCTVPLPGSGERAQLYVLTPKSTYPDDLVHVDWQLLVEKTTSPAALDTPRIAVSYSPIEIDYFARANWTDRAPEMVQRLIVESFENSGRIVAVGSDAIGLRSNILLKTELREFQAEYDGKGSVVDGAGNAPTVRVRMSAKLVRMPQRVIVASTNFEHIAKTEKNSMEAIVTAFDDALGKTIKDIVIWTLTEGEKVAGKQGW